MDLKQQLRVRLAESPLWLRWQRLQPRERLSLTLLGAFLLVVLFYLLLWQPAQQRVRDAREAFERERELYAYLQQNTELARQMSRSNPIVLAPEALQGLVTQSAQANGLTIESFDNGSDGSLQVSLPSASYPTLLRWFDEMQGNGAAIGEVSISQVGDGLVDARVSFLAGG
ncbi:type II secretion system protein M [Stutzerimonas chloritidismutans]|uniref:type II secretion system protein M n=1 Tax=Stutzerimonas chloritidismutans TaxID=203192 RepID=UPI003F162660